MKNKIFKQIAILIITMILAIHGYTAMASSFAGALGEANQAEGQKADDIVKTNSEPANLCIQNEDMSKITAVIEEPLDFGSLSETDKNAFRNCVRITICAKRDPAKGGKVECVSTLNKEGTKVEGLDPKIFKVSYNPVQVFLSKSGVDMLYIYIGAIYRWGASVIGIIAVLVIVISGIQISAAGGEQSVVTSAKTRITQSLIGIVILFLSGIILYTINPTFFTAGS